MYVGMYCYWYSVTIWNGDSNAYFRVPHDVLQHLRVHAFPRHFGAEGVTTYMRCDLRYRSETHARVLLADALHDLFPVQCQLRHPESVKEQKPDTAVDHRLALGTLAVADHPPKGGFHFSCHGNCTDTRLRFGLLNHIFAGISADQLPLHVDAPVLEIDV